MPHVSQAFTVDQPIAAVWDYFQDVPAVVTCMPGLELTGQTGEDSYTGRVKIKLGPITAAFDGEATFTDRDPDAHTCALTAKGIDKKGGNRAQAKVEYAMSEPAPGRTEVSLEGEITLTGALAQMGRGGIINDVAAQLTEQFATALRAKLASAAPAPQAAPAPASSAQPASPQPSSSPVPPPAPAGEIRAGSLIWKVIWHRLTGWLRRS